ncbi:MAG: MFS transporter [Saprospiraceae bacterium]|nr:MFS transporter [Saprospiraceae bacterium]
MSKTSANSQSIIVSTVVVAALGYFVDIYDLLLFSIVRVQSLRDIGVADTDLLNIGLSLLNWQMMGMLIGGIAWGVLGDKRGRLSVLFGSILLYSLANIANGFVESVEQYKWLRLIAGVGLAGELGAGITLVSEVMSKEKRGIGTTIVATVGIMGAVVAYFVASSWDWRTAYFVGGGLGLALLVLRISVYESGMFKNVQKMEVDRGNFIKLFTNRDLFLRYLKCILIGLPTWYVVGILVTAAREFSQAYGMEETADPGRAVMWCYTGLTIGDLSSGLLSQLLKSRKKAMYIFLTISTATIIFYLMSVNISLDFFYFKTFILGFGVGFWAIFVTIASEQFGTNIRATVTTTVPNFARGSLVPISMAFAFFQNYTSLVGSAFIVGGICMLIAFIALSTMQETFHKDLDYLETI